MTFDLLYEFSQSGLKLFERVFNGELDHAAISPTDPTLVKRLSGTTRFEPMEYATAKEMASAILSSMDSRDPYELLRRTGLWAWLTFVLRHQLFKRSSDGKWRVGELHRWYPSNPNDWQKGQRHLVRMPVHLLHFLGENADHLLCAPPAVLPEIREQLTSQQDMFSPDFQRVARTLYFDDATGALKRGAGGKGRGSPRRLARVRQQLDVTWSLEDLEPAKIMSLLPPEFARFKPVVPGASEQT